MKSIYIVGAVGNDPDYINKFSKAEKHLRETFGGDVINPVRAIRILFTDPEHLKWEEAMLFCLKLLSGCTHIYLLPDYHKSTGACIELMWAQKLNLVIIRENNANKEQHAIKGHVQA